MVKIDKNNLESDLSPYLKQHKNNPVNWQIWNLETLKEAKNKRLPILLSVGYASCHWCHVMAHESFEDTQTAEIMNKNFINIKVDREERPDLDYIFQSSFQLFNQTSGGWPLTMFLDENGVPFSGGTYFPKVPQNGLPAFKDLLINIYETYNIRREKIIGQSNLIKKSLTLRKNLVISQDLIPILEKIITKLDPIKGGYVGSPKFPTFSIYGTLIYYFNKTKNENYLKPVEILLKKLCSQGIYDHVEGGISRYTVDEDWLVPHFEKMLYDNVQLITLLSSYLKIKKNIYFQNKLKETINFINTEFLNKKFNLLGSAYDADSEGEEGKYYTFKYEEISNIKDIEKFYEILPEGNWENKIILRELQDPNPQIQQALLQIRKTKKKPFFDEKVQLDLNCMWISSLINTYNINKDKYYLKLAERFYSNLKTKFDEDNLHHSYSKNYVFLEDYAYYTSMLLDLYDATMDLNYKNKSLKIYSSTLDKFFDKEKKIFQKNLLSNNDLFMNPIDIGDSTIPNGNSIMLLNMVRLGKLDEAKILAQSLFGYLNIYNNYMTSSIKSLDYFIEKSSGKDCGPDGCKIV